MSAPSKALPLRMRSDLQVVSESFAGTRYRVVKDPLTLRYYRFQEEEFAQLELLDGRRSLEEMRIILEARFAPQQFPVEGISQFVAGLHQAGLVSSDARGQASALLERRGKLRRRRLLQALMSPLSIRLPGVDPTPLFNRLYPHVRWCFTRPALVAAGGLLASALLLIIVQYDEFQRRLPTFHQFFDPTNVLLLLTLLGGLKVVHELGHGLTCRHFGGECHEMGVMFLVFAPCLYCNVSDAWRLPKSRRIAISAAGMAVELVIAAAATFGWWFSEPGLWNQLCLGVMFVSGASTLLVNGNPLLRYDGYFILSDLVETPNLAEKSAAVVRNALKTGLLGMEEDRDPLLPTRGRGWFALYAICSAVYRLALTYSIYQFLLAWLAPYRLERIARMFGLFAITSLLGKPLVQFSKFIVKARQLRMKRARIVTGVCAAAVGAACIAWVPIPHRVWGTLELAPHQADTHYADVAGVLKSVDVRPGARVKAGDRLATLENVDLELEIARLAGRRGEYLAQLQSLRSERFQSPAALQQIPEIQKSLAAVEASLAEKQAESVRLTLVARRDGVVLPADATPTTKQSDAGELRTWSGLPTDLGNLGATLPSGTVFCRVGTLDEWEASLAIDQADIELLSIGQIVEIRFAAMPEETVSGRIEEISRRELTETPRHLSNKVGGELATKTDAAGIERPLSATYQALVRISDPDRALRIGLRGTAKIHVPAQPIAARVARWAKRTFHFHL
jgi:putative peptide zinc metalloprotease protein